MMALKKALFAMAGVVALAGLSSPAAAQITVRIGSGYGGYDGYAPGYGYGNYVPQYGYGYGAQAYGYDLDPRAAVDVCARSVERNFRTRVSGITSVEPRNNGAVRIHGFATTYGGYGYRNAGVGFSCKVDRYARVTDLQLERAGGYSGW